MRILYFHQYFKTREGSGGTRSYEMAKYFVEQGHQVTMVYGLSDKIKSPLSGPYVNGKRRGSVEGIDLIEFNLNYSNRLNFLQRAMVFLSFSFKSIKVALQEDFDIAFATSTPLTAGIPGIFMKMLGKKKRFVFEVRDLWPELPREMGVITNKLTLWAMGVLERMSYNKADACVALSPGIQEGIRAKLNDKSKPVYLVPNGCDLDFLVPGREPKTKIPMVREDDFVAIFTGAHGIANGLDAALDAAQVLKQKGYGDKIKLVFVGDGMQKDRLMQRAKGQQLHNCIFLDPVSKQHLITYLHAADVGLMLLANIKAFYYGTSPNKFFDYISMGMPILNNYPGWLAGMIQENNCGVVVPPNDAEAFANALIEMYHNKEKLPEMGENARMLAEREFDRKKLAKELLEALVMDKHESLKKDELVEC
ncbi:glycosyltransferase family 4 protein [Pontibacter sp. E15-1]|uniref:glycosyltransferase family 4 protein n=1 Tax=Pontibacter sp. E15-1 TaxID=2919918 RepID=UPI001F4FD012|nr:glycosyltransferase family 4 protein [Pontibacter sp. E15-1]MCJ8164441.1 glycosyltransferase family 4 protein [Pontibacter sp. E15-1]